MAFNQLVVFSNSAQAELLSDIFFELGALSVTVEDQFEGTDKEQAIFNEPGMEVDKLWEHSKITILFDSLTDINGIINHASELFDNKFSYTTEILDDQDWVKLTQNQFEPIKITETLYIVPSWHELPNKNATGIILDPGLAFGTGSHPTTFMCLKWIAENIHKYNTVLDYGCGSGILGITAKKMGTNLVTGVDIDNQAIESSVSNANNNQVDINFILPNQLANTSTYDLVVANILSNPLRVLAPSLASHTKQALILSGILDSQIDELSTIYSQWFNVSVANIVDGWVLLQCDKK